MRLRTVLVAAVLLALAVPAAAQTFVFDLRGTQEVPPVASVHSGGCHGLLDQPAATFSLTCVHDIPSATLMHIHRAPAGANGDVVFDLGDPSVSPVMATWTSMTPANIADLLAGNFYLNIHTAGRPAGEIRGQIVPRSVEFVEFSADGAQVVPPNGSPSTASCTAGLNAAATALAIDCTHNVAGAVAAHVHEAPSGINGPVVFTFPTATSPLSANMPMTPRLVADFAATFLYLDVHTPEGTEEEPGDEIRGQIGVPPAGTGLGTIVIAKESAPAGATGFGFTETITNGTFNLNDGAAETFTNVAPGTYTVTENAAAGYTLADLSCEDADSTTDVTSRMATIRLAAGELIRCTFRNLETAPADTLFVFHLSGDQEVPPLVTRDRGGCMGRFDAAASELSLVCVHDVELPTLMHIHRGAPGATGDIVFDMGLPDSPVIATWSGMTPADVADLLAGDLYLNIHTAGRPAGAIRGQIVTRTVDTIAFTANGSQVVPPGTTPATANCTADLDAPATALAINCAHTVPNPDVAHVHLAPRGENGPVVFTFPSPASPLNANMPLTPRLVAEYAAYFLYLEVHGPELGEETTPDVIRGQLAPPVVETTTGTIRIRKATSPAGGSGFPFTETMTPGNFTLDDTEEQVFMDVPAGTYTITEGTVAGWTLTALACSDSDSTTNPATRTATVRLQAGESVTCTFTNLQSLAAPSHFVFHLSGDQEVPPTGSNARGGCYGQLDDTARTLSLVCTHDVVGATVAHIHRAPAGANGDIAFDLGDPSSPIVATWNMTPAELADLLAGNFYVNIHASGRPLGEIRGQMLPRTVDRFTFVANGAQEIPPTPSLATGNCLANLADDAASVLVQCTHNVANPTTIHLHVAPAGSDGPVVYDFPLGPSFAGDVPLSPRLVADFAAGFLYVNIHAPDFEEGEIRGQLIGPAAAAPAAAEIPALGEWALLLLSLGLAAIAWMRLR
ncbi:MAG TPA: CHRD domain-containing protein [Thermoanaerobaculia bacterium]